MTISKAIQRLQWRFTNSNSFKINSLDIEAYNTIVDWINSSQKNVWKNNQLASKLYMNLYLEQLKHYNCEVNDVIPIKEINKFLEKSMDWHLNKFIDFLKTREMERITQNLNSEIISDFSAEETTKVLAKIRESGGDFEKIEVEHNLIQLVTEALRVFS